MPYSQSRHFDCVIHLGIETFVAAATTDGSMDLRNVQNGMTSLAFIHSAVARCLIARSRPAAILLALMTLQRQRFVDCAGAAPQVLRPVSARWFRIADVSRDDDHGSGLLLARRLSFVNRAPGGATSALAASFHGWRRICFPGVQPSAALLPVERRAGSDTQRWRSHDRPAAGTSDA